MASNVKLTIAFAESMYPACANVHSYRFEIYCTSNLVSELARAVRKNETRRIWKCRRPVTKCISLRTARMTLCKTPGFVSKALEYRLGLPFRSSSNGPASSIDAIVVIWVLLVAGSMLIVGIAHARSAMLIQKGSQRF
jgi:hypothetical protein